MYVCTYVGRYVCMYVDMEDAAEVAPPPHRSFSLYVVMCLHACLFLCATIPSYVHPQDPMGYGPIKLTISLMEPLQLLILKSAHIYDGIYPQQHRPLKCTQERTAFSP